MYIDSSNLHHPNFIHLEERNLAVGLAAGGLPFVVSSTLLLRVGGTRSYRCHSFIQMSELLCFARFMCSMTPRGQSEGATRRRLMRGLSCRETPKKSFESSLNVLSSVISPSEVALLCEPGRSITLQNTLPSNGT